MYRSPLLAIGLLIAVFPTGTSAQDVEMLGRRHGTRPPRAYYDELARNPDAFRFSRGRAARMREAAELRSLRRFGALPTGAGAPVGPAGADAGGPAAVGLGPRDEPVVGDIFVPVVLGLFSDSPGTPPVTRNTVQDGYFGLQSGTVADFYAEVSNDSIALIGEVQDWVTSSMTREQTTQGISGLGCCGIGNYIKTLLDEQGPIDWGAYDNDGPDGLPNSGDDDGYVDALAVIHPTAGAECDQDPDRIWSHKWTLSDASGSGPYVTSTPSNSSGVTFILIEDYFIQGAVRCSGTGLNEIGVFTHEMGHAFGLPDLYDTRQSGAAHDGAGSWDLMASGTWGCSGSSPASPCHMGAWSKAMLGWVTVDTLPPSADLGTLTLPPVETSGLVYRVDAVDGSDEYFLLENRQSGVTTYDVLLPAEGLLVWQIDEGVVDARWPLNVVNSFDHMGVWLRQADGLDELGEPGGDRGDSGDPFPGTTGNTAFHTLTSPAALSAEGTAAGLTVVDIAHSRVNDIDLRVRTGYTTVALTSSGTAPSASGVFLVDGATVPDPPDNFVLSPPFVTRTIEAAAGDSVDPGVRTPFLHWDDAPEEPRARAVVTPIEDTTFNATYSGTEYQLRVDLTGGADGVEPGSLTTTPSSPDLWFAPSTDVTLTATPQTGFSFLGWTGDLDGKPNPVSLTLDAPIFAGADFDLIYGVADTVVDLVAATPVDLQLQVDNGTSPISWQRVSGVVPVGVTVGGDGRITGASLDLGTYPLVLRATDALGLTATAGITLEVEPPSIPIAQLGDAFLLGSQPLDSIQAVFLDRQGNGNGSYDLGDFRAWVLANPTLPLSADMQPTAAEDVGRKRFITLQLRLQSPEGSEP